jgi:hypothetical protein
MILAIPAGTITDYLTKVVALLGGLTSPLESSTRCERSRRKATASTTLSSPMVD